MKTAEFVSPKHPDKMCDQISDAILDWCLNKDKNARVAIEVMGGHGKVKIMGEITMKGDLPFPEIQTIVHRVTKDPNLKVGTNIVKQSPEIANGVDTGGAGDQGIMVGYACSDNEDMIPQEVYLARSLCKYIFGGHQYDGKTQITLNDVGDIETIVASFQNVSHDELHNLIIEWLEIEQGITESDGITIHANPAGDWNQGGFDADTGLTGRKMMVDNYGPQVPIGGGAFSGKDPSKVDRSGAYMARKIAIDYLQFYDGKEATVKIAYAIGVAEPVMATANVDGTEYNILGRADGAYDLTPKGIRKFLELDKPQYEDTARWGHFGQGFKWDN